MADPLFALLSQGQGAPDQGQAQGDPLEALQAVLQDLHQLIALLPDPVHTRIAAQCLTALAGIQKDLMQPQQQGPQSAVASRFS